MSIDTKPVATQLVDFITKGNAHATFEQAVESISFKNIGVKPINLPYNVWMLAEHLGIAQPDILDFSINANYEELKWSDEYWPSDEVLKMKMHGKNV